MTLGLTIAAIYICGIFLFLLFMEGSDPHKQFSELDLAIISTWPFYLCLWLCLGILRLAAWIGGFFGEEPNR